MAEVAAIIGAGVIGAAGSKSAAKKAAKGQEAAAKTQEEAAKESLRIQEDLADYTMSLNEYQRHLAERNYNVGLGAYADQYGLTQKQFDLQNQQLDFSNRMRREAQLNLQNFTNLGLGSLPGLANMTGNTEFAGSEAYSGMRNLQDLGAAVPLPQGVPGLPMQSGVSQNMYTVNDDLLKAYLGNRVKQRYPDPANQNKNQISENAYSIGKKISMNPLDFSPLEIEQALEGNLITEEEAKRLMAFYLVNKQKASKDIIDSSGPGGK